MWRVLADVLISLIASAAGGLVSRFLVALGIGTVTAIGFSAIWNGALGAMESQLSVNAELIAIVQATGLLWLVSTVMSAISTRLIIKGLTSDSMSFWVKRMQLPAE